MILKSIFITAFSLLLIYSIIRPFHSIIARLFIMIGSIFGILSLIGETYAGDLARILGIGRAADLYLYLGLLTIFLFIGYSINRLDIINKRISKLTKKIAIENAEKQKD